MKSIDEFSKYAIGKDENDLLRGYRSLFKTTEKLVYLDGNSLGMMPVEAEKTINKLVSYEWGERLIRGWNESWWNMPVRIAEKLSNILGCHKNEVAVCDSTSVNLYKLLNAALKLQSGRKKILSDNLNFPSDLYIIQGVIENLNSGHHLDLVNSSNTIDIDYAELFDKIDTNTAVVVLSYVSFRSSFMFDMEKVNSYAHDKGVLVIWDLSHAAGAVEIELNKSNSDMAVGCTYKYLNGGPGSPAFLYVNREIQQDIISPVWGWLGEKDPFEFSLSYRPSKGAHKYMTGSPNILSMCTLEPSLDIINEAGMDNIRQKSTGLTGFMQDLFEAFLESHGFTFGSPYETDRRGSHISVRHEEGFRICKALIDENTGNYVIIPDFRPPDNIRLGFAPLYNSYNDVLNCVTEIERIVNKKLFDRFDSKSKSVT